MDFEPGKICGRVPGMDELSTEFDHLPEFTRYRDEGCELSSSCLNCSFQQCVYDRSGGTQHWLKKLRDCEITKLYYDMGVGVSDLALRFGLSQRTIQRIIKEHKGGTRA